MPAASRSPWSVSFAGFRSGCARSAATARRTSHARCPSSVWPISGKRRLIWVSSKPLAPFLKGKWPEGFKFLPVEYSDKLEYYTPAYLEHTDYPALMLRARRG